MASLLSGGAVYGDYLTLGTLPSREHIGPLTAFVGIIHLIPGTTVTVRRLHDIGRSGLWYWVQIIPIIGTIVHLVMMCTPGDAWENEYGARDDAGRGRQPARLREESSTIPRQVRMGNNTTRPTHVSGGEVQRFI